MDTKKRKQKKIKSKSSLKSHTKTKAGTRKKKFIKSQCSPLVKKNSVNEPYTCYTTQQLHKMRDLWNARHPDARIEHTESKKIWEKLRENMGDSCNRESCWLSQKFMQNSVGRQLLQYTFAPKSPKIWNKNPNEWLTSIDLSNVMKQYEIAYPNFDFIGPSPIDFDTHIMPDSYNSPDDTPKRLRKESEKGGRVQHNQQHKGHKHRKDKPECVWEELCEFNIVDYLKKGKNKIGVIFNLDPHYMEGSHWVALFVDIKRAEIFYFDSNGEPIPKQVVRLIKKITQQGKEHGIRFTTDSNLGVDHQLENTECGIYCLYFIIELLTGNKTGEYFKKHMIRDNSMEKLRKVYFNSTI